MPGHSISEVYYHPIDAAIRWAGLLRFRTQILASARRQRLPPTLDHPRSSELRLYTERIYDAIYHEELPYGQNGITTNDRAVWDSPNLTVRHIDLKHWMLHYYPGQRPPFLFSRLERIAHPMITLEAGHALLVEREGLKSQLEQCRRQLHILQAQQKNLGPTSPPRDVSHLSDRAEATYLNIIGGMLELMLGQSPSGAPYSSFKTQEAVVSALVAHYGNAMGIAERTLNGKFATARRRLRSASL